MISPYSLNGKWTKVKLGEVVDFLDHMRKPVTASDRNPGPYPYYGANGQQDCVDDYIFDEPLILLAEDGGYFGDPHRTIAYQIEGKTWVNNHAHVLRPKKNVDIRYLCRHLERYDVRSYVSGTTRLKLNKGKAAEIPIALPKLEEQKRIAAILDKADAIRRKRQEAIAGTRDLAVSAIEHELSVLSENGLETASLESICTKVTDGTHLTPTFRTDGIPFIFVKNIVNQRIDFDTSKYIDNTTYEQLTRTTKIEPGDVLYTTVGATYGQAALVETKERFAFQRHLAHLKPDKKAINSTYLAAVMNLPRTKWQADRWARGAAQPTLNLSELRQMVVPLPELGDQERIASIKQKCDSLLDKLAVALRHDDDLFNSLVQRAFKGEL